jgi:hypothetical protein
MTVSFHFPLHRRLAHAALFVLSVIAAGIQLNQFNNGAILLATEMLVIEALTILICVPLQLTWHAGEKRYLEPAFVSTSIYALSIFFSSGSLGLWIYVIARLLVIFRTGNDLTDWALPKIVSIRRTIAYALILLCSTIVAVLQVQNIRQAIRFDDIYYFTVNHLIYVAMLLCMVSASYIFKNKLPTDRLTLILVTASVFQFALLFSVDPPRLSSLAWVYTATLIAATISAAIILAGHFVLRRKLL